MTAQIVIAFIFGVVFVVTLIGLAIAFPKPTPFQYTVFRIVLSLAAAGVAAMVPGFIKMELNQMTGLIVRAGGALAVFAIVFFCNPAKLTQQADSHAELPSRIGDNPTLRDVWDLLDPHLQDAIALATNQARRLGQEYVSTRLLFGALRRLNVEPLSDLFQQIPKEALPESMDESISKDVGAIDSNLSFSACVRDSLKSLSPKATKDRKISSEDIFVDIAKHGHGESVRRLRVHGIDPGRIDQLVSQLGWRVIERKSV